MTFDPQLARAEMERIRFQCEHQIRFARGAKDLVVLEEIYSTVSMMSASALKSIKQLKRPQNFQMVCDNCNYERPVNEYGKTMCRCGERLRTIDLGTI